MRRTSLFALVGSLALGLAACSSTPTALVPASNQPSVAPAPGTMPAARPAAAASTTRPLPSSPVATVTLPSHRDPNSSISMKRSVYFDFDLFSIRTEDNALIERHGRYLASNPGLAITIEGNADERGSKEYNLALGQRRAESVLRALRIYGARDAQMEAISWGESKPRVAQHDESAWSQNRRADLQYPKQ